MKHVWNQYVYRFSALLAAAMLLLASGCGSQGAGTGANTAVSAVSSTGEAASIAPSEAANISPNEAASITPNEATSISPDEADSVPLGETVSISPDEADISTSPETTDVSLQPEDSLVQEDGIYYSKDEVSCYLHEFHHLPSNYISKKEARALGWEGGPLEPYAAGKAIGGDYFGNYEGILPEDTTYHECDIDTKGKSRGAKRLVWSADWDIYYTEDHYETFELLYTEEDP